MGGPKDYAKRISAICAIALKEEQDWMGHLLARSFVCGITAGSAGVGWLGSSSRGRVSLPIRQLTLVFYLARVADGASDTYYRCFAAAKH